MSDLPDATRVYPKSPTPDGGGSSSTPGRGLKLDQRTLMIGGAATVAVVALVSASRGGSTSSDTPTLDTGETDTYNALQPVLEDINNQLEMRDDPAPTKPVPVEVKNWPKYYPPSPPGKRPPRKPKPVPVKHPKKHKPHGTKKKGPKKPKAHIIRRRPKVA